MSQKQSHVCEICSSWMSVNPNNPEWLRCSQGHHVRVIKIIIELVKEPPSHAESAEEYYKKKRKT